MWLHHVSGAASAGLDSGDRPMQLRDLAAALRKSEDVNDKLRALKNLEGALLAAPDELKHHAGQSSLVLGDFSNIALSVVDESA